MGLTQIPPLPPFPLRLKEARVWHKAEDDRDKCFLLVCWMLAFVTELELSSCFCPVTRPWAPVRVDRPCSLPEMPLFEFSAVGCQPPGMRPMPSYLPYVPPATDRRLGPPAPHLLPGPPEATRIRFIFLLLSASGDFLTHLRPMATSHVNFCPFSCKLPLDQHVHFGSHSLSCALEFGARAYNFQFYVCQIPTC